MNEICPPIDVEEFCNIMRLYISKDYECKVLAEELLKPFVYDIVDNEIFLTRDFSFKHKYAGGFVRSDGEWSGPGPIGTKGKMIIENQNEEENRSQYN